MKGKYIDLNFICDFRNVLFGIATLLVIFFHTFNLDIYGAFGVNFITNILNFIHEIGNYGVDIFLFLSGIGLYFSMSKNNVKKFYKNRFIRIYPSFIIAIIAFNIFMKDHGFFDILSTLVGIPFFLDGIREAWYVQFVIVLYLFFPLIYKVIRKYDINGLGCSLFLVVLFNFIYSLVFNSSYLELEVALTRIPVFLIGTFFGKLIYEKRPLNVKWLWGSLFIQFILSLIIYFLLDVENAWAIMRYMYCFLAISSVINISWLLSFVNNRKNMILKILSLIGGCSLEVYLIHEKMFGLLNSSNIFSSYVILYIVGTVISIFCAYCLKKFVDFSCDVYKKLVYK